MSESGKGGQCLSLSRYHFRSSSVPVFPFSLIHSSKAPGAAILLTEVATMAVSALSFSKPPGFQW
jgi:hypothetical protein